ncbi:MAG TPA: hypothetical protein VJ746_07000 [Nitrospira sp.]|nr:hypothetical protein [Nitrospira sp.]
MTKMVPLRAAMGSLKPHAQIRLQQVFALAIAGSMVACASVDTILLTGEKFPPKESIEEVSVLNATPAQPHLDVAELRIGDSWLSFGTMQRRMLKEAAALGADAVVFAQPQTEIMHQVVYQPLYGSWGYTGPFYGTPWQYGGYGGPYGTWGPWGGGLSSGSIAVPYDETVKMLMGTAIRYVRKNETG